MSGGGGIRTPVWFPTHRFRGGPVRPSPAPLQVLHDPELRTETFHRGARIRTGDLCDPNAALYRTEPRPVPTARTPTTSPSSHKTDGVGFDHRGNASCHPRHHHLTDGVGFDHRGNASLGARSRRPRSSAHAAIWNRSPWVRIPRLPSSPPPYGRGGIRPSRQRLVGSEEPKAPQLSPRSDLEQIAVGENPTPTLITTTLRTGWDSNPRGLAPTRFPIVRLKPLGHPSRIQSTAEPLPRVPMQRREWDSTEGVGFEPTRAFAQRLSRAPP